MRGFLKSREGIFQLALDTTTIGKEGCDLVLSGDCASCIQAVITYSPSDASFTLHDINSSLGVYVNDCRLHNAAVQLAHNDYVRFGYTGIAYEFLLECQPKLRDYQGTEYLQQTPIETGVGDGAGWVAGIRKDLPVEDYREKSDVVADDNKEIMKSELVCLRREVGRLLELQCECSRKDDLIVQLRDEVTNLQNFVRHVELDRCPICQQNDRATAAPTANTPAATGCVDAMDFMRAKIEGSQQEATVELVTQMHRDMNLKDETISRLARELDSVKKELLQKDCHVSALQSYLSQLPTTPDDEQYVAKDAEVILLRHTQKQSDDLKEELSAHVTSLTDQLNQLKIDLDAETSAARRAQSDAETLKLRNQDLERIERQARVDIEQLSKRLEKIRGRAVQTALAGSAASKTPDKLISDDDLIALLKKCADERADLSKRNPQSSTVDIPGKGSDHAKRTRPAETPEPTLKKK